MKKDFLALFPVSCCFLIWKARALWMDAAPLSLWVFVFQLTGTVLSTDVFHCNPVLNCFLFVFFCFLLVPIWMRMTEEYTKISTPRQEVLFKKGSIGAKKRVTPAPSTGTAASNADSGSEQDSVNGNAASSPVSPAQGDADSFQYGGKYELSITKRKLNLARWRSGSPHFSSYLLISSLTVIHFVFYLPRKPVSLNSLNRTLLFL